MRTAALALCVAYWLFLTLLLLTSNPAGVVGLHHVPIFPWGKFGVHLSAFIGLSFLVHTTRWPVRPCWYMLLLLTIYAVTTECTQFFVPHRTSRPMDCVENLLGITIGTAAYCAAVHFIQPLLKVNLAASLVRLHLDGQKSAAE